MGGMIVAPFWPTTDGAAKQFGLMNSCDASPDLGLHVTSGLSWMSVVPRSDLLLMLKQLALYPALFGSPLAQSNAAVGIVALLRLRLKF